MSEPWPQLSDETQRLEVLEALQAAAGKQPDERFDRIARMATRYLNVPIALISLIDGERQSFKAALGLDRADIPRGQSICAHALAGRGVLVVPDLRADARFRDYPVVREGPRSRSYAGHPLVVAGRRVGTLCVMDTKVRCFDEHELAALIDLAAWAESELLADQSRHLVREMDGLQRRTEMVLEGVAEGIIGVDASGAMTFINGAAEQLLGWPPGELIGRDMHTTLHARRADGGRYPVRDCPVSDTLRTGRSHRLLREVFWRRDDTGVPVDWSAGAVTDGATVIGAVVVFEDATRRVEVERIKDEFVSVVSHELRTPLTSLRGALALLTAGLLGEDVGPDAERLVGIAHSNAERLARLVDDILDLEKSSRGDISLQRAPLQIADLLHTATGTVRGATTTAGVSLEVTAASGVVWGDEHRLLQVLTNLLGNAVRFSTSGGAVRLRAEVGAGRASLIVGDDGMGIPVEAQNHVFERFWQVDASDTRARSGTGLGLAIAKNIVEAHGGSITVQSEEGIGSTFTVTLPQRQTESDDRRTVHDEEWRGGIEVPADRRRTALDDEWMGRLEVPVDRRRTDPESQGSS